MRQFEITCPLGKELRDDDVRIVAARVLRLRNNTVINVIDPTKSFQPKMSGAEVDCYIAHRSIDARGDVKVRYQVEVYDRMDPYKEYQLPEYKDVKDAPAVIVVGSGPAGMFAALRLLMEGYRPIVLERGKDVHKRKYDISSLSRRGELNGDSNYCYGEGGAGTFSDGKLFTRSSKRGDIREVLHQFVNFGADRSILIDAHPHIGTDKLPRVVENIRNCILEHGGEYHFNSKVVDIEKLENGELKLIVEDLASGTHKKVEYQAASVILATGHSSREIYELFQSKGWDLEAKGFAMGVRVEHPQSLINKMRYHGQWEPGMPAAEYNFVEQVCRLNDEGEDDDFDFEEEENAPELHAEAAAEGEKKDNGLRGVFSFCMCPGGILVPSSTEDGTTVMNGMSNSARNSKWANSGVVVQINPEDVPEQYKGDGAFGLMNFQRDVERAMFNYVADYRAAHPEEEINQFAAPAQRMVDFCEGRLSKNLPATSYHPGAVSAPLHELLPDFVAERLQQVFPLVNMKVMRGYYTNDALLLGVESRTSSPIRILRDKETCQCPAVPGLFPCGEGAGYSGGIVSSAIDGINAALAAVKFLRPAPVEVENPTVEE